MWVFGGEAIQTARGNILLLEGEFKGKSKFISKDVKKTRVLKFIMCYKRRTVGNGFGNNRPLHFVL